MRHSPIKVCVGCCVTCLLVILFSLCVYSSDYTAKKATEEKFSLPFFVNKETTYDRNNSSESLQCYRGEYLESLRYAHLCIARVYHVQDAHLAHS